MADKTYGMMNWRDVEGIVYADVTNPHEIMGLKDVKGGTLIQIFVPDAVRVSVIFGKTEYSLIKEDESGFFARFVRKKLSGIYKVRAEYEYGSTYEYYDAYQFKPVFPAEYLDKFACGISYNIYEYMGAHASAADGISGVRFAVWAPEAVRVSVVGDFNMWDGRRHIMSRDAGSGVFEIFIPGIGSGDLYKYEIVKKGGGMVLKADPYGCLGQKRPDNASVIYKSQSNPRFRWSDGIYLKNRKKKDMQKEPISIYELHPGSWRKPESEKEDKREVFYNYREIAPILAEYVKEMNYTHIELLPVMEHPLDASWGYQVTGYYAPTSRYGTPDDFKYFVDYMHGMDIGVILDWVPAHFPKDEFGLAKFDGSCLYEHFDSRKGEHPHWGTCIYNYARPQVSNFLIANCLYWVEEFHADGIRMDAVASMLYLDYGRNDGEWIPNIYGGKENLEAIEFLKHLNSILKRKHPDVLMIAEESTAWPKITGNIDDGGLGFDFKWNMGWMNDFGTYMRYQPIERKYHYNELTFSMIYAYSENFICSFSHDEVVHGKGSMIGKMPGDEYEKFANLRLTYGYMMAHPGKKLLFMGQEFGQYGEWNENTELAWESLKEENHEKLREFVKAINGIYIAQKSLYGLDNDPDGFEWMDCISWEESIIAFLRKSGEEDDFVLVVCNFDNVERRDYILKVPERGKYKEIINSDNVLFGGKGAVNPRVKSSKKIDDEETIKINLPALGMSIFKYRP